MMPQCDLRFFFPTLENIFHLRFYLICACKVTNFHVFIGTEHCMRDDLCHTRTHTHALSHTQSTNNLYLPLTFLPKRYILNLNFTTLLGVRMIILLLHI